MNSLDLKDSKLGDMVEYQRPARQTTTYGTFQGWYSTDDGQTRLIVRNLELAIDIVVDPKWVTLITRQSEAQHEP